MAMRPPRAVQSFAQLRIPRGQVPHHHPPVAVWLRPHPGCPGLCRPWVLPLSTGRGRPSTSGTGWVGPSLPTIQRRGFASCHWPPTPGPHGAHAEGFLGTEGQCGLLCPSAVSPSVGMRWTPRAGANAPMSSPAILVISPWARQVHTHTARGAVAGSRGARPWEGGSEGCLLLSHHAPPAVETRHQQGPPILPCRPGSAGPGPHSLGLQEAQPPAEAQPPIPGCPGNQASPLPKEASGLWQMSALDTGCN